MDERTTNFLEALKAQHAFPGTFTFKFIGKAGGDFVARVVAEVRATLGASEDPPFTARPSDRGGHVSVTLMPIVASAEAVVAVYERLGKVEGVLVSL